MKIICDEQKATLTIVPVEDGEEKIIATIAERLKPEEQLYYAGRQTRADGFCNVLLSFKETEDRSDGEKPILICGTSEEDKNWLGRIRDLCFFATGGLVYLGKTEVDGKNAVFFTGNYCKLCGAAIINTFRAEWKVCKNCAGKCDHQYLRGPIHGPSLDIGMGESCEKCGLGKPRDKNERPKSVLEHHLQVERELGIKIVYDDGPPVTPGQTAEAIRIMRRHKKSQSD